MPKNTKKSVSKSSKSTKKAPKSHGKHKAPAKKAKVIKAKAAPVKKEKTSATSGDVERLTQALFKVLGGSGYVKPRAAAATEENLRRMIRRMELNANDTDMWLGMLRQIDWKLGANEKDK